MGLLGLAVVVLAAATWLRYPPPLSAVRARLSLVTRCLLLLLLVLALAGLSLVRDPTGQAIVVLADRSASVAPAADQERDILRRLLDARHGADQLGIVAFGREALVEAPPGTAPAFSDFSTEPNPNYTSVDDALRLASTVMPAELRHHVVVVSDGRENIGSATTQARLLRSQGTRVDVLPLQVALGPDVRVDGLDVPAAVPPGNRVHAAVRITSSAATSGPARVFLDHALVADVDAAFPAGSSTVDVTLPPASPGFHDVRVEIAPLVDTYAENNSGEALFEVLGAQRALVVEGHPGAAANLVSALAAVSVETVLVSPSQVPSQASGLAAYQAVALVDVPAADLGDARMGALQVAVKDLGLGLAAFGGPDTFGPGDYAGTPLEAALPIDMQISDRSQKPPIAVVLVLESMESSQADAVMRSAAKAVVGALTPKDFVGVTDGGSSGLAVPLQPVKDRKALENQVAGIQSFGDSPDYSPYISAAADALAAQKDAVKHIVVVGDGDAIPTTPGLLQGMAARGITVSAIGINVHGQAGLMDSMRTIARDGKGRFTESDNASQVPQLLLQETEKGLKPWIVEQRFRPAVDRPSGVLAGIAPGALPPLDGYVAATPKGAAEVVLRSAQQDPVLAEWQYGLGRTVAWTSDIEGRWSKDLLASPAGGKLLANMVAWTLPLRDDPDLGLRATSSGDTGHLIAELRSASADTTAVASIVAPDLATRQVPLLLTASGRFEGDFPADQVGAYILRVTAGKHGRPEHAATAGLAVAYSPEFRFLGTDMNALSAIARAGGGQVLGSPDAALRVSLPPLQVQLGLAAWLLALAAVLLPVDVALRRLVFRRGDAEIWAAVVRRGEAAPAEVEATLGRLRGSLDRKRAGRLGAGVGATPSAAALPPPETGASPNTTPAEAPPPGAESGDLAARLLERRRTKKGD
ncbi:MAG: VWA domain-containing protein [Candidatus Dormibacteria bacterium]